MYPLKQTYFNLAHFLLREAVVAYEDKDDKIVCQKHLQCSQDLFRNVMIMSRKDIVYFGEGTLGCFNIKHYNYRSL